MLCSFPILFSILCCNKGHPRKLAGHKTNRRFVMPWIINLWNLLQKDLVSGKSLHGSRGRMDEYLKVKSTVDWYGNHIHFRKATTVKQFWYFKIWVFKSFLIHLVCKSCELFNLYSLDFGKLLSYIVCRENIVSKLQSDYEQKYNHRLFNSPRRFSCFSSIFPTTGTGNCPPLSLAP